MVCCPRSSDAFTENLCDRIDADARTRDRLGLSRPEPTALSVRWSVKSLRLRLSRSQGIGDAARLQRGQGTWLCGDQRRSRKHREALDFARHAESLGASAVMAIPPVATSLEQPGDYRVLCRDARGISIPLVVQDASSYVGSVDRL